MRDDRCANGYLAEGPKEVRSAGEVNSLQGRFSLDFAPLHETQLVWGTHNNFRLTHARHELTRDVAELRLLH